MPRISYFIIALSTVLLILSPFVWMSRLAPEPVPTENQYIERHTKNDTTPEKQLVLKSYFLDLGRGESTVLLTPGGKSILIDTGDKEHYKKLSFILNELKIKKIDYLFLTTNELDHIGAFPELYKNYSMESVFISKEPGIDAFEEETRELLLQSKNVVYLTDNKKFSIEEGLEVYSLYSFPSVLKFQYIDTSILMMSDANFEIEEHLIKKYNTQLKSMIIKVANHGQSLTSSDEFIKTVDPQVAIILGGDTDDNGRPSYGVIERLTESWIDVYRNDVKGSILITLDGENYEVNTNLNNY